MDKKFLKSLLLKRKLELIIGSIISFIINFIATGGVKLFNISKIKNIEDEKKYINTIESIFSLDIIGCFLLILFIVGFTILLFNNKTNELKKVITKKYMKEEIFISKYILVFIITFIGVLPNALLRFLLIGGIIPSIRYLLVITLVNLVFFTFFMLFQMIVNNNFISAIIALYIPCTFFFLLLSCQIFLSKYFWIFTDLLNCIVDLIAGKIINYISNVSIVEKSITIEYTILIFTLVLICCIFMYLSYMAYKNIKDNEDLFYFVFIRRVVYYINAYNIIFLIFTCILEVIVYSLIDINNRQEFIKFIFNMIAIGLIPIFYEIQENKEFKKAIFNFLPRYKLGGNINANSRKRAQL